MAKTARTPSRPRKGRATVPAKSAATPPVQYPVAPPTPSTPSAQAPSVEGVEGVEGAGGRAKKPHFEWQMEAGLDTNFSRVGEILSAADQPLFRHREGGLVLVEDGRPCRITAARELAPLLIDQVRLFVTKNGKYQGERPSDTILANMLGSRSFLRHFRLVEAVVTTPVVLDGGGVTSPGFNPQGGILYLGREVRPTQDLDCIRTFLDVMEWNSSADRTNAVAALLTVPFRHQFHGGKPFVLVTATKSHAGKGTLTDFIRGRTAKAEIAYEDKDWPMQRNLHDQLVQNPETGVINFDNVRTDSSGRAKLIRTGFLESFITNAEIVLSSATSRSRPFRAANTFVVLLNTNEGALSIDLLNRSLPIRLDPQGDLTERISRAKGRLGGDVKHEWLPSRRERIEAEMWGMIDRWRKADMPLDRRVRHPMGPWAATIGGILSVNGFSDFLANYSTTRAAADPVREALGILAFHAGNQPRRSGDLAKIAVSQGVHKVLLAGADAANEAACQRAMGVRLAPYLGETFTVVTAADRLTFRLKKENRRWDGEAAHFRYTFEEVGREAVAESDLGGLVLEDSPFRSGTPLDRPVPAALDTYQPGAEPAFGLEANAEAR